MVALRQPVHTQPVHNVRYYVHSTPNSLRYEVDERTGETLVQLGEARRLQKEERPVRRPKVMLDDADRANIVGKGGFEFDSFRGQFYNGTDWTVSEVTLEITVLESDQSLRWSRRIKTQVSISPYSSGSFAVDVSDCEAVGSFKWRLVSAVGRNEASTVPDPYFTE